jgi:hypothetical protein
MFVESAFLNQLENAPGQALSPGYQAEGDAMTTALAGKDDADAPRQRWHNRERRSSGKG